MKKLVSAVYDDFHPFYHLLEGVEDPAAALITSCDPMDLDKDCALILHGGGDISPALYKQKVSVKGYGDEQPNRRDRIEWLMLQRAIELEIPIFGICRGAQMLCAAAGGKLIQHLDNHAGSNHEVETKDGETFIVNSLHHQMMYPFEVDHELVGWSANNRSDVYYDEDKVLTEMQCEPEFVFFPKIKGFAAQWHPEAMRSESPATQYLLKTIKEKLKDDQISR